MCFRNHHVAIFPLSWWQPRSVGRPASPQRTVIMYIFSFCRDVTESFRKNIFALTFELLVQLRLWTAIPIWADWTENVVDFFPWHNGLYKKIYFPYNFLNLNRNRHDTWMGNMVKAYIKFVCQNSCHSAQFSVTNITIHLSQNRCFDILSIRLKP